MVMRRTANPNTWVRFPLPTPNYGAVAEQICEVLQRLKDEGENPSRASS